MTDDNARVVLVDMDGVLADFDRGVFEALVPTCPDLRLPTTSHRIRLQNPQYDAEIRAVTKAPGFFRDLRPIDAALDGWQRLLDLGYHPRICSSPLVSSTTCEDEKRGWLREHLGADVAAEAHIVQNKCECPGLALIDDIPEVTCGPAPWPHIVFDHAYNRHAPSPHRLRGWRDPELEPLLAKLSGQDEKQYPES
jgi:5'-nucleotidase